MLPAGNRSLDAVSVLLSNLRALLPPQISHQTTGTYADRYMETTRKSSCQSFQHRQQQLHNCWLFTWIDHWPSLVLSHWPTELTIEFCTGARAVKVPWESRETWDWQLPSVPSLPVPQHYHNVFAGCSNRPTYRTTFYIMTFRDI